MSPFPEIKEKSFTKEHPGFALALTIFLAVSAYAANGYCASKVWQWYKPEAWPTIDWRSFVGASILLSLLLPSKATKDERSADEMIALVFKGFFVLFLTLGLAWVLRP